MKILAALFLALAIPFAFADDNEHGDDGHGTPVPGASSQTQTANADSAASAAATASASSGSNSLTVKTERNAASASAGTTSTTAPCYVSRGIGFSLPVGGISLNAPSKSSDCLLIARADAEYVKGNLSASRKLLCATKVYQKALGEDCEALLNEVRGR